MLIDVKIKDERDPITEMFSHGRGISRIEKGIYECGHHSFEYEVENVEFETYDYGVCDNWLQLKRYFMSEILEEGTCYVIYLTKVIKSEQPKSGGWRWHKWGSYIGTQNPQCEYLADEPKINEVFCYSVLKVINKW